MFCQGHKVNVAPLPDFNVERYMGLWYEIARLDHCFERNLERVTARYRLNADGSIRVQNHGYVAHTKTWKNAIAIAHQQKTGNYFRIYFSRLIGVKYRVAYVDTDYQTAIVSGSSTRYLWFLARTPQIDPLQLQTLLQVAQQLGYDTSRLIYTLQKLQ